MSSENRTATSDVNTTCDMCIWQSGTFIRFKIADHRIAPHK